MNTAKIAISEGVAHKLPDDLRKALSADESVIERWEDLTPLARNEWICWVITVKKEETRKDHIKRTVTELLEGKRRPCCWIGCIHRKDKPISPSVRWALNKQSKSK
ncbi:MAG TPA: YdeI/OmpD-associated family protein [Candidatus Saccharimonadales bacterium]|nr:YdeI/OmpD-associated family protein [Candidatus Saccharimonadales bacterium]